MQVPLNTTNATVGEVAITVPNSPQRDPETYDFVLQSLAVGPDESVYWPRYLDLQRKHLVIEMGKADSGGEVFASTVADFAIHDNMWCFHVEQPGH